MPNQDEAKTIYNAIKKNGKLYDRLNEEGKKAYWQYSADRKLVSIDKLNDAGKAEYQKYVNPSQPQYAMQASLVEKPQQYIQTQNEKIMSAVTPQGIKNMISQSPEQIATKRVETPKVLTTADKRRLLNERNLGKYDPQEKVQTTGKAGLAKVPTASNRMIPVGKAGIIKTQARDFNGIDAALLGALDTTTFGALNIKNDAAIKANKGAFTAGQVAGYIAPGTALTNAAGKGLAKLGAGKLVQNLGGSAIAGSVIDTSQGLVEGDTGKDLAKRVGRGAVIGLGADLGLMGLGKIVSSIAKKYSGNIPKEVQEVIAKAQEIEAKPNKTNADAEEYYNYIGYLDEVNRKTPEYIKNEARLNVPKAKEIKTLTKTIETPIEATINKVRTVKGEKQPWEMTQSEYYAKFRESNKKPTAEGAYGDKLKYGMKLKSFDELNVLPKDVITKINNEYDTLLKQELDDIYKTFEVEPPSGGYKVSTNDFDQIAEINAIEITQKNNLARQKAISDAYSKEISRRHKLQIDTAINEGKPIPEKVLKGYPDLRKKSTLMLKNGGMLSGNLPNAKGEVLSGISAGQKQPNGRIFNQYTGTQKGIQQQKTGKTLKPNKPILSALDARVNKPYDAPISKAVEVPTKPIGELKPLSNINTLPIENKSLKKPLLELKQQQEPGKIRKTLSKIYSATVDNTSTTAKVSSETEIMNTVARNAGATVDTIIKKGLVNMEGQKIEGKAMADIFNMPQKEAEALETLLFETHNIDRVKQAKELTSHTTEESRLIIDNIKKQYPHLEAKAKEVNTLLTNLLDEWGVKSGLVDNDLRNLLKNMYQNYVPGYRELPGVDATSFKSRGMGPAKIINKAIGGDDKLMSLQKSIPMMINKMVKSARKNELYREILKAAETGSEYAKVLEPVGKIEEVLQKNATDAIMESIKADGIDALANMTDSALTADPKLGYLLTVMDDGKPVKLQIKEELFKSLQALNGKGDDDLQAALKLFKKGITNPFKSLITGYNPMFAVRNVARDIPTAYIQGSENNPVKFAKNLLDAGKDMFKNADEFAEYKALGGEGGNYFNVEKGLKSEGKLEKVLKPLAAINNFTETLPRYAEYKGTLKREGKNYSTKMKALHNAQEVTVNFGKHGDVTKAIDAIVPYLNPAVQGLDKTRKTFAKPEAWAKALGVISAPTAAIYTMNQVMDKKGYDQLDNRTKDTYFVFPQGNGKFIKVPKTRESGAIFGALFERVLRQIEGQPEALKGYGETIKTNFLFQNPWTDNIASPLVSGIGFNKDFAGRNVVPTYMLNDKRSPKLQFDERTSELAKEIGDKFNLSPKQIDYIIKSYGGIVGSIVIPATTKGGNVVESVVTRSFTADAAYSNGITNGFYDKLDKLKNAATDKNITLKLPSKLVTPEEKMSNLYASMTRHISDIRDGITQLGSTDEARTKQQQLLDILAELNKETEYSKATQLKNKLITMAKEYKK
jgi:hypothetical protein